MPSLMKGKVWSERKHLLKYPVVAEIKYDEIRVHVKRVPGQGVQFLSYAGKPLRNLEYWATSFEQFMCEVGLLNLDCGVEVNGNFNDSYRWVRSSKGIPGADEKKGFPALDRSMVRFILFDLPDDSVGTYRHRRTQAAYYSSVMRSSYSIPISVPGCHLCFDEEQVELYFREIREQGYEGLMVKSLDHLYHTVPERTDGWLKMKPEETADGRITEINRAVSIEGVPLDRAGSVTVVLEDGSIAQPAGIEHNLGRSMFESPGEYIGQWIEFKFMHRDRAGGYRHPSFVRFREDKQ